MDYDKIIHSLGDAFVVNKEAVMIRQMPTEDEKEVVLLIVAEQEDTARLIGRKGIIEE